jgi:hypothetical protein
LIVIEQIVSVHPCAREAIVGTAYRPEKVELWPVSCDRGREAKADFAEKLPLTTALKKPER